MALTTVKIGKQEVQVLGNIQLPTGMNKRVKIFMEGMGPSNIDKFNREYQTDININQCEAYAVFQSMNNSDIEFALDAALKAMPGKRKQIATDKVFGHGVVNSFDMPMRFVAGMEAAIKILKEKGYEVYADLDTARYLYEYQAVDTGTSEVTDPMPRPE